MTVTNEAPMIAVEDMPDLDETPHCFYFGCKRQPEWSYMGCHASGYLCDPHKRQLVRHIERGDASCHPCGKLFTPEMMKWEPL